MRIESGASSYALPARDSVQKKPQDSENGAYKNENNSSVKADKTEQARSKKPAESTGKELSESEQKQVSELKKSDRMVRQHEMAHLAAAAGLSVSGAQFEYKRGPDGVMYAVGGEVSIDTSPVSGDPEATLAKARQIERAALAPVDPSGQDRQVAAKARQMAAEARLEMMKQAQQGLKAASQSVQKQESQDQTQGQFVDIQA